MGRRENRRRKPELEQRLHLRRKPRDGHDQPLSFPATGLTAGKTYHFRVVAKNGVGTSNGFEKEFTMLPAVSNISTEDATEVSTTSATLHGSFDIDAEGGDSHYYFQYGAGTSYGSVVPIGAPPGADAGSDARAIPSVQQTIEVTAGQTIHFRIVASNSFGTTFGEDKTFTAPNKPSIVATSSANVTASTADLIAKINPNGDATTYHFEYGTSPAYDHASPIPDESIGNGETPVEVSQHIEQPRDRRDLPLPRRRRKPVGRSRQRRPDLRLLHRELPERPRAPGERGRVSARLPRLRARLARSRRRGPAVPRPGPGPDRQRIHRPPAAVEHRLREHRRRASPSGAESARSTGPIRPTSPRTSTSSTRTSNGWETHYPGLCGRAPRSPRAGPTAARAWRCAKTTTFRTRSTSRLKTPAPTRRMSSMRIRTASASAASRRWSKKSQAAKNSKDGASHRRTTPITPSARITSNSRPAG